MSKNRPNFVNLTETSVKIGFECPYCRWNNRIDGIFMKNDRNNSFYSLFRCKNCEVAFQIQEVR